MNDDLQRALANLPNGANPNLSEPVLSKGFQNGVSHADEERRLLGCM